MFDFENLDVYSKAKELNNVWGENIKKLRAKQDLSQDDLARKVD